MKLRNKKTGEIYEIVFCPLKEEWKETDENRLLVIRDCNKPWKKIVYKTLAELNEEWEDYKPKEPLIKDEKVRKLISDWAKLTQTENILVVERRTSRGLVFKEFFSQNRHISISILGKFLEIEDKTEYSLDELCGSEE